jgi:prevent-host-death family protein
MNQVNGPIFRPPLFQCMSPEGDDKMQVAVSEAKGLLLELVRKAEGDEEIILTRHGHAIARIVGIAPGAAARRAALEEARGAASAGNAAGAARSQDFLYDEAGLPA